MKKVANLKTNKKGEFICEKCGNNKIFAILSVEGGRARLYHKCDKCGEKYSNDKLIIEKGKIRNDNTPR